MGGGDERKLFNARGVYCGMIEMFGNQIEVAIM